MTRVPLAPPVVVAAPTKSSPSFVPRLRWPSLDDRHSKADLHRFPTRSEELSRHGAGEFGAWSDGFMTAVRSARERVWLIDGFLLKVDDRARGSFFPVFGAVLRQTPAQSIRLLTANKAGHEEQIEQLRTLQDERRAPPRNEAFTIEVRLVREGRGRVRLPHDRFAIVDDELWHWGANVGGTHHEVNAYSRGWSADETGAADYFKRLWNDDGGARP